MPRHLNSYITVATYETSNLVVGKTQDSRKPRTTEVQALDRIAFGDLIAASNAAALLNKADMLRCSDCKRDRHFLEFPRCKTYNHRHGGRGYQCHACLEKRRLDLKRQGLRGVIIDAQDEAYLRSKKNNRRKAKNLDARTG